MTSKSDTTLFKKHKIKRVNFLKHQHLRNVTAAQNGYIFVGRSNFGQQVAICTSSDTNQYGNPGRCLSDNDPYRRCSNSTHFKHQ